MQHLVWSYIPHPSLFPLNLIQAIFLSLQRLNCLQSDSGLYLQGCGLSQLGLLAGFLILYPPTDHSQQKKTTCT